eukprot:CAMPEP_0185752756 /NCGR_PEP_ID=MMETSP1174-20130828/11537_1 /TAXON_ID=35687 /ORGANISM="Dictyocha speculum, Strain CCMP1381" /LENGTH=413 /DNA_ID=CAMNT_0028430321 /DNA_START=16 /DNA_END=1257 /DNA_ORIENTATION=+
MAAAFRSLAKYPISNPITFGVVFSTVKTSGADLMVQLQVENRPWQDIDWRRNSAFGLFGMFYLGGVQYGLYVELFGRMFPKAAEFAAKPIAEKMKDPRGTVNMLTQVFLDQCVHHPLLYFPVFYSLKEVVAGGNVMDGMRKYQKNWREDMWALWKVWVPSTIINFTFSPMWMRIPFVASTSLIWTVILSTMRGRNEEDIVDGSDFLLNQGAAFDRVMYISPKLDHTLSHFIHTSYGPDKPGILAKISRSCADFGGNLSESKMLRMGEYFMMMAVVSIDQSKKKGLLEDIDSKLGSSMQTSTHEMVFSGLRRSVTVDRAEMDADARFMDFEVSGIDKPGITAEVCRAFLELGINIERMETQMEHRGDEVFFHMKGVLMSNEYQSTSPVLMQRLKKAEEDAGVSIRYNDRVPIAK